MSPICKGAFLVWVAVAATRIESATAVRHDVPRGPRLTREAKGSGEGLPKPTDAVISESQDYKNNACKILPAIPGYHDDMPRFNFTFKNRVLPEHCEMIYYGSCRNSLQCQICDENRVIGKKFYAADKSIYETPGKTFCQKVNSREGRCVPCARCSVCTGKFRETWETHEAATDCRVPSVCPSMCLLSMMIIQFLSHAASPGTSLAECLAIVLSLLMLCVKVV
jgi:hypothetical protein